MKSKPTSLDVISKMFYAKFTRCYLIFIKIFFFISFWANDNFKETNIKSLLYYNYACLLFAFSFKHRLHLIFEESFELLQFLHTQSPQLLQTNFGALIPHSEHPYEFVIVAMDSPFPHIVQKTATFLSFNANNPFPLFNNLTAIIGI